MIHWTEYAAGTRYPTEQRVQLALAVPRNKEWSSHPLGRVQFALDGSSRFTISARHLPPLLPSFLRPSSTTRHTVTSPLHSCTANDDSHPSLHSYSALPSGPPKQSWRHSRTKLTDAPSNLELIDEFDMEYRRLPHRNPSDARSIRSTAHTTIDLADKLDPDEGHYCPWPHRRVRWGRSLRSSGKSSIWTDVKLADR